ncbi:hypothetical protein [Rheinheimera maricola]|uniref:GOLD domain-containing protein n=1 Tax=Rheinheimera maricola TaxID=2793282 RepID=A0ABS7X9I4_9GAMM|nr:hypothetical protein [Rheinheimera maricola]MBZ9611976.1 hypothetical protein [Rheinheimera maricola]
MFITSNTCGTADGMLYNEPVPGTYVFQFPVEEKEGYKFCYLLSGKAFHHSCTLSTSIWEVKSSIVDFFGIWHDGLFHTYHIK